MKHEELTHKIISCAYKVHNTLGFGFLESVYKKGMVIELTKSMLKTEEEKPLKVYYDNQVVGEFYIDLLIEDEIVIELKSVENLTKAHACPVQFTAVTERSLPRSFGKWYWGVFNRGSSVGQLPERLEKRNRPPHSPC